MRSLAFLGLIGIFAAFLYFSNRDNKKSISVIERDLKTSLQTKEFQKSLVVVNEQLKKNNIGQVKPAEISKSSENVPKYDWELGSKKQFDFPEKLKKKIFSYMNLVKHLDEEDSTDDPTKFNEVKDMITLINTDKQGPLIWQAINSNEDFLDCSVCFISLLKMTRFTSNNSKELYRRSEEIITTKAIEDKINTKKQLEKSSEFYLYKEAVNFYLDENKESISNGDDTAIFKIKASNPHPIIIEFMENKIKGF